MRDVEHAAAYGEVDARVIAAVKGEEGSRGECAEDGRGRFAGEDGRRRGFEKGVEGVEEEGE